jgi:sialic acid synthase SpsE/mannose-6-phosphate isomerase-like protein (cupin superfamily)
MKTAENKPLFILEMANNHMGDVEHGKRIIREFAVVAKDFDYDFAFKLQYRHLDTFIHPDFQKRTDVKFVKRFSETRLREEDFVALKHEMTQCGFKTMCTPFDERSVDLIEKHGYEFLKIGSCSFTDWPLLERIGSTDMPIVASAAGASWEEIDRVISFFDHREKNVTLMHCVAQYPTETKDLQLNQIELMRQRYPAHRVGFSTHENPEDNEVILAAIGKGATVFERHVAVATDKYQPNAYSSTPAQFRKWLETARKGFELCGVAHERMAGTPAEIAQLAALSRGVFAKRAIKAGERLTPDDYFLAMPCEEGQLLAKHLSKYRVVTATKDIAMNAAVKDSALTQVDHQSRVRSILTDVKKVLKKSKMTLPSSRSDLEISHHYGIEKFYENGAVLLNFINREYCKKVLVMLPGQRHPEHAHQQKEETFYVVHGDITIALNGEEKTYKSGDLILVNRGVKHHMSTKHGVIFEEISSTHFKNDSYYSDESITKNAARKTLLTYWMD